MFISRVTRVTLQATLDSTLQITALSCNTISFITLTRLKVKFVSTLFLPKEGKT